MKKLFFLLTAVFLLGVLPMRSNDNLYVYKTDGSKQTFPVETVQKLTFSDITNLVINKTDGTTTSFNFSDLKFISLKDYGGTGIIPVSQPATEVSVWSDNGNVWVKSARTIIAVNIFDLQGRKVAQLHPQSQEINVSLANYPAGVYLVQITDETSITTKKIIKN
ncbi:MAG: T9SS type A sorting domain-containing protein [Candidatus Symbiothrix sp.]|nr:T9SS type A sorting domain-containing protein [Candidatus Symbiothrix sp.]